MWTILNSYIKPQLDISSVEEQNTSRHFENHNQGTLWKTRIKKDPLSAWGCNEPDPRFAPPPSTTPSQLKPVELRLEAPPKIQSPLEIDYGFTPYELLRECRDAKMKRIVQRLDKCLNAESVLILGENGTGKELIAKALHQRGNRAKARLSIVDCANLTPEMMQSALFGHVRGAFTGAHTDRKGAFELADGGMVFLDEIGEIPLHLQAGLLRVLQSHRFCRLGGDTEISSDFNLITATNRDLPKMVKEGTFREDLYFRIEQFVIEVPSLRERVDDLVRLASHFVDQYSGRQKMLSAEAEKLITRHSWPGNVRELRNCIIRGISYSNGTGRIEAEDLELRIQPNAQSAPETTAVGTTYTVMESAERALIVQTLKQFNGNKVTSATHLGIGRQTLYNKIKRYSIDETEY